MGAISRWLDRFCYKHPRLGIPGLMKYIVIANVAVYLMDMFSNGYFSAMLRFYPALIMEGQVWRLLTFIFVPTSGGFILWFALTTLFYYYIGNALENQWGSTRFTVFYGVGVLLNIFTGMVTSWISGAVLETASMYYVNMSMFFAFATLYPDMRVLLYGILPLKVKWLAWVDAALFAFDIGHYFMNGNWVQGMVPIVAILNYFIFFWDDLMAILRRGSSRAAHRVDPQTINFKKAQKEVQNRKGYLHKCAVCGITDADDPNMEFRYCSKCNGYYCYCMKHINDHVHIQ